MADLARIKTEIDELSPEDRDQLAAALAYSASRKQIVLSRSEQCVVDVLRSITHSRTPTQALVRDYGYQKFQNRVEELLDYIGEARKVLRRAQVQGLIEQCLQCLASDLRSREIPVTPSTMLNSFGHLRHAVDQDFPGYAAAGHLHRLVG